jgi:hypothetical protein
MCLPDLDSSKTSGFWVARVSVSFGGATPLDSGHSLFQYFGMVRVFLLAIVVLVMVTGVWLLANHHATYIYDVF